MSLRRSLLRRARPWLLYGILLGVTAVAIRDFCLHPSYEFPPPRPFAGERWYNPYAEVVPGRLRACFHAHSTESLGGLSQATAPFDALHAAYRRLGYDVIGISEYQAIRPEVAEDDGRVYVRVYEHGYGAGKQHQTVIGAGRIEWRDYICGQGLDQKQHILDLLGDPGVFIVANHPNKWQGYADEDFDRLTGVHGIEIETRYSKGYVHWDRALSAGKPVWGICSDDAHRPERPWHIGSGWVWLHAKERSEAGVLEALRTGRFESVWAKSRGAPNALRSLEVVRDAEGDRVELALVRPAEWLHAIGQGGEILRIAKHTDAMSIPLGPEITYVRFAAKTDNTFLYLNPVFRTDADDPVAAAPRATVASGPTALRRSLGAVWGLAVLALGIALVRERRRARSAVPTPTTESARAETDHGVPAPLGEHFQGPEPAEALEVRRERDRDPAR